MSPDSINASFEMVAGFLIWLSIHRLYKDKIVRGIHWLQVLFFTLWGFWNLYYYPHLGQFWSTVAGVNVALANTVWFSQMIYYIRQEKKRGL